MGDARRGQREAFRQSLEHVPAHRAALLAAPPEAGEPDVPRRLAEPAERPVVVGHAVFAVMAAQHAGLPAMLFGRRQVHEPRRLLAQRRQLAVRRWVFQQAPPSLHAQRPGACRQAGRRLVSALIGHRLRPGGRGRGDGAVAPDRRPAPPQGAEARRAEWTGPSRTSSPP